MNNKPFWKMFCNLFLLMVILLTSGCRLGRGARPTAEPPPGNQAPDPTQANPAKPPAQTNPAKPPANKPPASANIDLQLHSLTFNPQEPGAGAEFQVTATVGNVGNAPSGAFTVRWYPNVREDVVGCSWDVDMLAANAQQQLTCRYRYAQADSYTWAAVVDAEKEIREQNEDNNTMRGNITVKPGGGPANTPPTAPINCSARAVDAHNIRIKWDINPGGSVDGFRIYQGVASLELTINDPQERNWVIPNLDANTQYHFDVRTFAGGQESPEDACSVDVTTLQ